jgi:hypothetical protein
MIRILTKKAFRFTNHKGEGSISRPKANETPEEAAQRSARDAAFALSRASNIEKHKDHIFDVQPGVVTTCPDWIKSDELFNWGVADDDIVELVNKPTVSVASEVAAAEAGETAKQDDEGGEGGEGVAEDGNMASLTEDGTEGGPVQRRRIAGPGRKKAKE